MMDMEWMAEAVCATHPYGAEFWFPNSKDDRQAREAAQICQSCPVIVQCAEYRKRFGYAFGVWGGRTAPASSRGFCATKLPPPHGSPARYKQHLREKTAPCVSCRTAMNRVRQEREERRTRSA